MLIVLLILSIFLFVLLCYACDELGGFAIILPIICIIFLIINICKIVDGRYIDDQIKLYTEENAKIETAIDDTPPLTVREGGMIRKGYNADVDYLRGIRENG